MEGQTVSQGRLNFGAGLWVHSTDGDRDAFLVFSRHYSFRNYKKTRRNTQFVGPGYKIVLVTPNVDAIFVWRKFIDKSGQTGVNCAVFRNESKHRSSDLILEAEKIAWARWPDARLYTYVNAKKIKSPNPGFCFKKAGWKVCGTTKKRSLVILEKLP